MDDEPYWPDIEERCAEPLTSSRVLCPLCGKPESGPPGEEMRTGSKGEYWRTCSNVKHQR